MATIFVHDDVMDALLTKVKTDATKITVCKGSASTYSKATKTSASNSMLASISVDDSDFTIADSGSDRKYTTGAQNSVSIDASGSATCVCVVDGVGSKILVRTTCTKQNLTKGGTVTIPAFVHKVTAATKA